MTDERTKEPESFFAKWERVIKPMFPKRCPRCGLTAAEAYGMDCCDFASRGIGDG